MIDEGDRWRRDAFLALRSMVARADARCFVRLQTEAPGEAPGLRTTFVQLFWSLRKLA